MERLRPGSVENIHGAHVDTDSALLHRLGSTVIHEYADSSKDPLLIGSIGTGSDDNYIRLLDMIHCLLLIFV